MCLVDNSFIDPCKSHQIRFENFSHPLDDGEVTIAVYIHDFRNVTGSAEFVQTIIDILNARYLTDEEENPFSVQINFKLAQKNVDGGCFSGYNKYPNPTVLQVSQSDVHAGFQSFLDGEFTAILCL